MKKINVLLSSLYVLGFVTALYALYQLPTDLVHHQVTDLTQSSVLQPVLNRLYLMIGIPLLLGAAAVVSLWMDTRKDDVVVNASLRDAGQSPGLAAEEAKSEKQEVAQLLGIEALASNEEDAEVAFTKALSLACHHTEASQAAAYCLKQTDEYACVELFASFAYHAPDGETVAYRLGEGLVGQVAKQGERINIDAVPEGYIEILSGLGRATPTHLLIMPVRREGQIVGVVEMASFQAFSLPQADSLQLAFDQLALKLPNNNNVSLAEATG